VAALAALAVSTIAAPAGSSSLQAVSYEVEPELAWNLAVGLLRSDPTLRAAIDAALDRLLPTARCSASMRGTASSIASQRVQ
jgi:hypothetical protein